MRKFGFALWLYGGVLALGILYLPLLVLPQIVMIRAIQFWAYYTLWGLKHIVGVSVEIRGRENLPQGGYLIASKHQCMLDTIVPWVMLPLPAFVLKKELLHIPLYGWHSRKAGMIPVDRAGQAAALKDLVKASQKAMTKGRQIIIFPEGTRQLPGAEPDYKPGVAALYRDLNVPCVPVALNTGLVWPARGLPSKPGHAVFEILEPIPAGLTRGGFMSELKAKVEAASNGLL